MRILLLSGLKIFPNQSGGHLRTGGIAKSLARMGHDVCLYSLAGRRDDYGQGQSHQLESIEPQLSEEINLSLPIGLIQTTARRLAMPRVWQYMLFGLGLVPKSLKTRLDWAEVIVCDFPYTPPVPGPWSKKPWVLISHNLEHKLLAQGLRLERLFAPWMRRVENRAALRYDAILACAKEDQEYYVARSGNPRRVRLVPNGIDPLQYRCHEAEGRALRASWGLGDDDWVVVFSGSRFGPNLEALEGLKDFCASEAAFLREKRIHFLILGSMEYVAARREGMIITGSVPKTLPYFAAADAAINPVVRGSGSNVKIFEYIAAQLPVISSTFGVRGTNLEPKTDYIPLDDMKLALSQLVARSKADWAAHTALLWQNHKKDCDMTEILRREWKALPSFDERAPYSLTRLLHESQKL
jgi:glycosyltransferase involved in cell wall biosynthesis